MPLYRLFISWGFQLVIITSLIIVLYFIATGAMQLRPGRVPDVSSGGKAGQGVPVGVAQPSILIDKMTVGGTKL